MAAEHVRDPSQGSAKYMLRLAAALSAAGHQVRTAFADDLPELLAWRRLRHLTFPTAVALISLAGRYDIVHVASGDGFLASAIAKLLPRRHRPLFTSQVLGMEHLAWDESRNSAGSRLRWRHRLYAGALRLRQVEASIRLSDLTLCLSEGDRQFIVDRRWLPEGCVATVHPGLDPVFLESPPATLTAPNLLFLGSWTPRKGIADLVRAFIVVHTQIPTARLVVAGGRLPAPIILADFPPEVRAAIDIAEDFPDPPTGLIELMRGCSIGVLPSHYEGFGMAFAEMMSVGLPVVGTATGGMPDLIEPGVNGLLVAKRDPGQLASAIVTLLKDPALRGRLGSAARQTAHMLTWERAALAVQSAYERSLNSRTG